MFSNYFRPFRRLPIYVLTLAIVLSSFSLFAQSESPLRVLYATPEMYPLVATGGLGEVAEFIPAAVVKEGNKVDVILPKWSVIDLATHGITPMGQSITVTMPWGEVEADLYEIKYKTKRGVRVILVDSPKGSNYFDVPKGQRIYYEKEYEENIVKFSFFSKAVLEYAKMKGSSYYDVIHANDWTTALVPWYKKYLPRYSELTAKTVYSIHNLGSAFQGTFDQSKLWLLEIDPKYLDPSIEGSVLNFDHINLTKAAISSVDQVATVSHQYSLDIKGKKYGNNLDGALTTRDIVGIAHGVDLERYDPSTNGIRYMFDETNFTEKKLLNKGYVMDLLGLPLVDVPLFIVTSRGDAQKNAVLMYETLKRVLSKYKMQVVVMGDGYENIQMDVRENLKQKFEELQRVYNPKLRFMKYDASFHPQLEAAADAQIVISAFEPGGLEPDKAKLNKVICIVHPVNGLKEAVIDIDDAQSRPQTGIKVYDLDMDLDKEGSIERLAYGMKRAIDKYSDVDRLKAIRTNMEGDYSWTHSGKAHVDMYKKLIYGADYDSKVTTEITPIKPEKTYEFTNFTSSKDLSKAEILSALSARTGSASTSIDEQLSELMNIWADNDGVLTEADSVLCFGNGDGNSGLYQYLYHIAEIGTAENSEEIKFFLILGGALFYNSLNLESVALARSDRKLINLAYRTFDLTSTSSMTYIEQNLETRTMFKGNISFITRFDAGFNSAKIIKK